jgi:23S rRNA (cytosine1962-C5)-methyltransferase
MNPYIKTNYKILDCGDFKKLEIVDNVKFVRPAASAIGAPKDLSLWKSIDVEFERTKGEGGKWHSISNKKLGHYQAEVGGINFNLKPTPFGHLGIFYEQIDYWKKIRNICKNSTKTKVLNLFAYTGGSTLAAALGGAKEVVHLDASKTSVEWAKQNADLNNIPQDVIKWIVDDALSFVKREVRRGRRYDAIILDPPSYGRGPKNQVWKIEDDLPKILDEIKNLLSDDFLFIHLSAHTPGITPLSLENLLIERFGKQKFITEEMVINTETGFRLPSGASCWMEKAN